MMMLGAKPAIALVIASNDVLRQLFHGNVRWSKRANIWLDHTRPLFLAVQRR